MAAHGLALEERSSEFGHAHCGAQPIRVICSPLHYIMILNLVCDPHHAKTRFGSSDIAEALKEATNAKRKSD